MLNTPEIVQSWVTALSSQITAILKSDDTAENELILNNASWVAQMDVLTFLRDIGKHFSVNVMIAKDSVKQRLERPDQGISFTEFSYSLLQSYDFAELNKYYDCSIQIGGNDQ